jgi:quercetin dioxygenase-like cupin family protein
MRTSLALILVASLTTACAEEAHEAADADHTHDAVASGHQPPADTLPATVVPATDFAPEYIRHATGVEIIPDIRAGLQTPSNTFTHEGNFGPLLFGQRIRSFYIRLEPGMFLAEHPHPTESLVFTVDGRWVLASEGKRQVMEAGSTFHFGDDVPTGWEAPFPEGALLYIVKTMEPGESYESYTQDLRELARQLDQEMTGGGVFYFHQLPPDHEAIRFAREHSPHFDEVLARRYD